MAPRNAVSLSVREHAFEKMVIRKSGQNAPDIVRGLHANETCDVLKDTLPANSSDLSLNDHNQLSLDRTSEHHCRPNSKYTCS